MWISSSLHTRPHVHELSARFLVHSRTPEYTQMQTLTLENTNSQLTRTEHTQHNTRTQEHRKTHRRTWNTEHTAKHRTSIHTTHGSSVSEQRRCSRSISLSDSDDWRRQEVLMVSMDEWHMYSASPPLPSPLRPPAVTKSGIFFQVERPP
ncbi:hypothetical protein Pcinc_031854 [Petrolisthes cinctipes]|uniref:Uncharacterized protein n=1 Tax=Petrolisthes cinctipes TaxID=88211 RepID=A0AAE1K091_PETCI|nr:hypothetical protein Pcinc_031854 [Petrolisthes cinctipes]